MDVSRNARRANPYVPDGLTKHVRPTFAERFSLFLYADKDSRGMNFAPINADISRRNGYSGIYNRSNGLTSEERNASSRFSSTVPRSSMCFGTYALYGR